MKVENIYFDTLKMGEFIELKRLAYLGEAIRNAFASGLTVGDDKTTLENEDALLHWDDDL